MAKKMGVNEYGRYRRRKGLRGGTGASVSKALRDGKIRADEDGLLDPKLCDRMWEQNTRPVIRRREW